MNNGELIKSNVYSMIRLLQNDLPSSKSTLSKLRRGIGKDFAESPESWEMIFENIHVDLSSKTDSISESERAIHAALSLYAMHQQSKSVSVNDGTKSFAEAVPMLINSSRDNEEAIVRRFNSLLSSEEINELTLHLRSLIQLMRSNDTHIAFDYSQLAKDIYFFQFPDGKNRVKLDWGKKFYRNFSKNKMENGINEQGVY